MITSRKDGGVDCTNVDAMTYRFSDCELHPELRELRRNGDVCAIEPRVFDLLQYLIENRHRVISKDEIVEQIWERRYVTDASLSTCLKSARSAIGDDGRKQTFIRTFPRRGVRFVAHVSSSPRSLTAPRTVRHRAITLVCSTIAIIAVAAFAWQFGGMVRPDPEYETLAHARPMIAVLPYTNLTPDSAYDHIVDGMTEDLITDLSKIFGAAVIARNAVSAHLAHPGIITNARIRYILKGSVRLDKAGIRVSAQLLDADSERLLWADRFDGVQADEFAMQDRVTAAIVKSLAATLAESEKLYPVYRGTSDATAHNAYLIGLRHLNAVDSGHPEEVRRARRAFRKAIFLDPNFAAAHAGLAWVYWMESQFEGYDVAARKIKAIEMAARSLKIGQNPLAHRLLARQYLEISHVSHDSERRSDDRYDDAVRELRKAVALEPSNADSLAELADYLNFSGSSDEAARLVRIAKRLNPNFPIWYHKPAGIAAYLAGRYDEAADEFRPWFENDVLPLYSAFWLAAALAQTGDVRLAGETLQATLKGNRKHTTTASAAFYFPFKNPKDLTHLLNGLRKAGLPDAKG